MRPEAHLSRMRPQGRKCACIASGSLDCAGPGSVSVVSREVSARPGEHLRPGVRSPLGSVLIPPLGRGREERGVAAEALPGGEEFPESWGAAAAGATAHSPARGAEPRGVAVRSPSEVSTRHPGERCSAPGCRVCPGETTRLLRGDGATRSWRTPLSCVSSRFSSPEVLSRRCGRPAFSPASS